ncbi:MAG: restriction endonuclease subunit S [Candidatus Omnitrophica bacterium]|nr:restriction endonuclease subunit S [Candidatus Omnitrophota bacterium]
MKNWQTKKLGEVIKLEYGKPLPDSERKPNGAYPVYGANGEKDRTDEFYYDKPSIIVGRKGSAGEVNLTEKRFWPLDVTYFVTFDDDKYSLGFLYNLLLTLNLPKLAKGVKPGINRNEVYEIRVNIPPLPDQKRIVKILDEVFEKTAKAKENAEKNLQNSRELFESYLQSINAEKESLGSLVDITTGKLDANAATENGQYSFFTCSREIFAIDKFAFDCEAILLAGNNAVGDFNVKHYKGKFNAYQRTYVITVNKESRVLYRYLYFQMLKSLKKLKMQSVGAGTKFLKMGMIKDFKIALPSITEQKHIISKLDTLFAETKKLEAIYTQKLADLEELKKSILKKAFNGEL